MSPPKLFWNSIEEAPEELQPFLRKQEEERAEKQKRIHAHILEMNGGIEPPPYTDAELRAR
jgi:hypothetical protein